MLRPAVLFFLFMICALPALAQDMLQIPQAAAPDLQQAQQADQRKARELALEYHDTCMKSMYTDLSPETHEIFCGCSAEAAAKNLNPDELSTLAGHEGEPLDPDYLNLAIVAPCLATPLGELEFEACLAKPQYLHFFKTQDAYNAMCACIRDGAMPFLEEYGYDLVNYIQTRLPSDENIIARVRAESTFRIEVDKWSVDCMNKFAYK